MLDDTLDGAEPRPASPQLDPTLADRIMQRVFGDTKPEPVLLGRFEIERPIGAGAMGQVFLARDPVFDRRVAIKRMTGGGQASDELAQEARALAQLQHPNVVAVHELLDIDGAMHLVMEYVAGKSLAHWQGLQPRARVLDAYQQAGRGLAAVHRAGLVHRDFKPANVLVGSDLRVRVADFGLATVIVVDEQPTALLCGTPEYMAPELYAGRPPSPHSDQFAFCVALWEGITGQRPFDRHQLAEAGLAGALPELPSFAGPRWLCRVLTRGLAYEPGERWPDMDALVRQLERGPVVERRFALGGGLVLAAVLGARALAPNPPPCSDELWTVTQWRRFATALERAASEDQPALRSSIDALVEQDRGLERERAALCESASDELALAQLACLDRMSSRSAATRERLLAGGLDDAPSLLESLPNPEACQGEGPRAPAERGVHASSLRRALEVGFRAHAAGRMLEAISIADTVLTQDDLPAALRVDALMLRARAGRRSGRQSEARRDLIDVLEVADASVPLRVQAACELAELEAFSDELRAAELPLELARAGVSSLPLPSLELELLLARAEVERARAPADAIPLLERALDSAATGSPAARARVRLRLANAKADAERFDAAIEDYLLLLDELRERFGASHPSLATLELNLGLTYADAGRWLEAREHFTRAVDIETRALGEASPTLAPMLAKLAEAELELGDCERSEQLARRARALRNDADPAATHILASALLCRQRFEELDAIYAELLAVPPDDPDDHDTLRQTAAWTACRLGQFDRAAALVAQTRTTTPWLALRIAEVEIEIALARGDVEAAARRLLDSEARMRAEPADIELAAELAWLRVRVGRGLNWSSQARDRADALHYLDLLAPDQKNEL